MGTPLLSNVSARIKMQWNRVSINNIQIWLIWRLKSNNIQNWINKQIVNIIYSIQIFIIHSSLHFILIANNFAYILAGTATAVVVLCN